jgi:hypothetical protein
MLGAGYGAGVWTERHSCKVPPPPTMLGELSAAKQTTPKSKPDLAPKAAELAAEIAKLRPEIEAFRERMLEIDREMDRDIEGILRADQLEVFHKMVKKFADLRAKEDADLNQPTPLTAEEIVRLQQKPLYKMMAIVVVPMRVEWNTRDLNLDASQQEKLREILRARRDKFIALVDSSPPPSLMLSRLAPVAQRLGQPTK